MNPAIETILADVAIEREQATIARCRIAEAKTADEQNRARAELHEAMIVLAEAWHRAGLARREERQAERMVEFQAARTAHEAAYTAWRQAAKPDKERLYTAVLEAERIKSTASLRMNLQRDLVRNEDRLVANELNVYGPACAWAEVKQLGIEAFIAGLPINVLEAIVLYVEAETLPLPNMEARAVVRQAIAAGQVEDAQSFMDHHDRFNWNVERAEAERQARAIRRGKARHEMLTPHINFNDLQPGERLELRLHAERGQDVALTNTKGERLTRGDMLDGKDFGTHQPLEVQEPSSEAAETATTCVDTNSESSARQNGAQQTIEDEAPVIQVPDVATIPEAERLAIVALARTGLSRGKICESLYNARGGRAFSKIKAVLDAAGM
jgi:hypothetical protein